MIDVIIPVYNVEKYLKQCIDSVLKQTLKNYHIILVNDGSTDKSGEICDDYAQRYSFITVVHQVNSGLSAARNKGLSLSKSQYIVFLDSDDWIEPNTLEALYNSMVETQADIVCCNVILEFGTYSLVYKSRKSQMYVTTSEILKTFLMRKNFGAAAWSKLYRRELFNGVFFPVGKIHEDIPVITELILKSNKLVYLGCPLWHYRQQENSLSRGIYSKKNYALYENLIKLSSVLKIYPDLRKAYEGYFYIGLKGLLSLFKTKEVKEIHKKDYEIFVQERNRVIVRILVNSTISIKEKILILFVGTSFYEKAKLLIRRMHL